jgi:outer membrane protein assembly factor BamA
LELLDDNVFGIGTEFLIHSQYGNDRQCYFTDLRAHRIFSTYLTAQIRLYHSRWDRAIYGSANTSLGVRQEKRYGGLISIGQQIARLGTVTGSLVIEEVRLTDSRDGQEERLGLRSLHLQSLVETFNRMPFPETGKKHFFELQVTGKALGGDIEFTKFFSSLEAYFPLGHVLNFHPKVSIGVSRTGLPPSEKFYAGGNRSFYGFRDDQLSGDKILLANQELRAKLPLWLYIFARYDVGDVYVSADQIKLKNLRHAWGLALAVATPLGPIEFGYGVVDRDTDRFYFNAGLEF